MSATLLRILDGGFFHGGLYRAFPLSAAWRIRYHYAILPKKKGGRRVLETLSRPPAARHLELQGSERGIPYFSSPARDTLLSLRSRAAVDFAPPNRKRSRLRLL